MMLRAITLQPMNARFRRAMAEIFRLQGRAADARVELEKAEAFAPHE
jgi:Flp pilus assembly protein TadD